MRRRGWQGKYQKSIKWEKEREGNFQNDESEVVRVDVETMNNGELASKDY